jgi:hypothetical protein
MKKIAIVTFNGEMMCFIHGLINALDMSSRGHDVKLIIEGSSTGLIEEINREDNPFNKFYKEVKERDLLEGICKACANKMGTLDEAKNQGLTLLDDLYGHPSLSYYIEMGYEIITL